LNSSSSMKELIALTTALDTVMLRVSLAKLEAAVAWTYEVAEWILEPDSSQ
jgi:hypothetical protein